MNTTKSQPKPERMPQVPQPPLPELAAFLAPLLVHVTQEREQYLLMTTF